MDQRTTITPPGGYPVKRIEDPDMDKIIKKNAKGVHGKTGVGGIFKVTAVYQKKPRKKYKPPNYLSPPPPDAPEAWLSNLSVYKMRTVGGWILPPAEESLMLMLAKKDDLRLNRPDLAELDKNHIWPPRRWWYQFPKSGTWEKRWRRDRARGIWPEPNLKTWSFRWVKNGLALQLPQVGAVDNQPTPMVTPAAR
jgi:hypothetical protein